MMLICGCLAIQMQLQHTFTFTVSCSGCFPEHDLFPPHESAHFLHSECMNPRMDPHWFALVTDTLLYDGCVPGAQGGVMRIVVDGYNAPVTAGNFVDLVARGFYDGMDIQRADGFVVQTGKPAGSVRGACHAPQAACSFMLTHAGNSMTCSMPHRCDHGDASAQSIALPWLPEAQLLQHVALHGSAAIQTGDFGCGSNLKRPIAAKDAKLLS